MATARRPKGYPPPPQTPRILHLPRRQGTRRSVSSVDQVSLRRAPKGKLEMLFGQERTFCYTIPPVVLHDSNERGRMENEVEVGIWEEKWKFQAEILRAECKFLRMERDITSKKMERERSFMERTLKSALHALLSAKKKIKEEESVSLVLEEEIEELTHTLGELQRSTKKGTRRDPELLKGRNRGAANFDKGVTLLQKQLQRIGALPAHKCTKDLRQIAKANLFKLGTGEGLTNKESHPTEGCNGLADVEVLSRKMEGLSKGKLLKKMEEEYGLMVFATPNSASTSKLSSSLQEQLQETGPSEQNICAGQCKALVRRIMEQVRAETEQWSQMQEMLGQVREEMEELQASRDFWEDQALHSDCKIKTLNETVEEWKQKGSRLDVKEKQLEELVKLLQEELQRVRVDKTPAREKSKRVAPQPQGKENKLLTCRVKGNSRMDENRKKTKDTFDDGKKAMYNGGSKFTSPSRLPLMDIGNLSPLVRHSSRRSVFPLQSPKH